MSSSHSMTSHSEDELYNYSDTDDYPYDFAELRIDEEELLVLHKNYYTVLNQTDIQRLQQEDINDISSVLQLSDEESCLLLRHFNWNLNEVKDQWFANEEKVRKEVGIFDRKPVEVEGVTTCGICFESSDDLMCVGCGHLYCQECWILYLRKAIDDGPGCLTLRCPELYCYAAVGQGMMDRLGLAEEDKERYNCYLRKSYVEKRPTAQWCPAPGCEYAVEYIVGSTARNYLRRTWVENRPTVMWCPATGCEYAAQCVVGSTARSYDVVCGCSNAFCWKCTKDAHSPVDCKVVSAWVLKNSLEEESMKWILENTKPCSKCKRPVENERIAAFLEANVVLVLDKSKMKKQMPGKFSDRYARYYERWTFNNVSRQDSLKELNYMQNVGLETISKLQNQPKEQMQFCVEAWQQIVECRRILKWSCAYGYSLPARESSKHNLFEAMQGEADAALGKLQHCAEIELKKYIKANTSKSGKAPEFEDKDFNAFRTRLISLTKDTRNFFKNLVQVLENGLCDVGPDNLNSEEDTSMIDETHDESPDHGLCFVCTSNATRENDLLPE